MQGHPGPHLRAFIICCGHATPGSFLYAQHWRHSCNNSAQFNFISYFIYIESVAIKSALHKKPQSLY